MKPRSLELIQSTAGIIYLANNAVKNYMMLVQFFGVPSATLRNNPQPWGTNIYTSSLNFIIHITYNKKNSSPFRYKLQVNVEDETGSTVFVIFDKEMEKILQIPISELYSDQQVTPIFI